MQFHFHVPALPHTVTSKEYNACAYTQKVFNFCKMMMNLGHIVYHYGVEGSHPPCTEHITVFSRGEQKKIIGETDWKKNFFTNIWDTNHPCWKIVNNRVIAEITLRKQQRDFLCVIGGNCQKSISDAFPEIQTVEYGIGYHGIFSRFRVFESYAWMHYLYGVQKLETGSFYDMVIPNYFDEDDFPFSAEKDNYYLYLGRVIKNKGLEVASETVKQLGGKLIIAGQGVNSFENGKLTAAELTLDGPHLEYAGYADVTRRGRLLSRARALFLPTYYIEPFGGTAVEAQLCGTPVITTDWGAFPETVLHGVTGFRCRTLEQFIWAAQNISQLNPAAIREYAVANYSLKRVALMYQEYFSMLYDLWDKGWYQLKERDNLDFLRKTYV